MKRLGEGGQGEVWLLEGDPPLVMKKALLTHDYASYLKELRELSHENVVRYYDCPDNHPEINRDEFLLFMEYCEHGSLLQVLGNKELVYSVATIAKWAMELFTALEYIKSKRIVHQDVKPDNLFVHGDDFIVKLGDFGIVRDLKDGSNLRGGTRGYMAPEVLNEEETSLEDAYKCDIYGAGWVVLDMINRSNPGNKDIDGIFANKLPYLDTMMKLVDGCTKENVKQRFGVEKSLALCKAMTTEFNRFEIKPDPNPHRKLLVPPIGLDGQKGEAPAQFEYIQPPAAALSINSFCISGPLPVVEQVMIDPRERLLLDLKEKLGISTTFENYSLGFSDLHYTEDATDPEFVIMRDIRVARADRKNFDKIRRQLCDQVLAILCNLEIEDQYHCAQEMEVYWKKQGHTKLDETHPDLYERFVALIGLDSWEQGLAQDFGVQWLVETDRATLPHWAILKLLDQNIKNIEELGKLFIERLTYRIVILDGSRYAWFHLKDLGIFLRKDCSETRLHDTRTNLTKMPYHFTKEREPLNSEQIRRALMEARTYFVRKLRNQRASTQEHEYLGPKHFVRLTLSDLLMSNRRSFDLDELLAKLAEVPGQPFPGYVFLYGIPPAHECRSDCQLKGGFPKTAEADFQFHYHQCATSDQIDYIETYTLLSSAMQYAMRWRTCELWLYELISELVTEIQAKERKWVFFFELTKLHDGGEALLFEFYLTMNRASFITKDFQLAYSAERARFLRFVPVKLGDILPILQAMLDYYNDYDRIGGGFAFSNAEINAHDKVMERLVGDFWKRITTAEPSISPSSTGCSVS